MSAADMQGASVPPQNMAAERSVLGSMMLENDAIDEVAGLLKPEHFYSDIHQMIYEAILKLYAENRKADILTIADGMNASGKLEEIGGPPYLLELLETVPHAAHVSYYAEIVIDKFRRRGCLNVGRDLIREAADSDDINDAISKADMNLVEVANTGRENRMQSLFDTLADSLTAINARGGGKGLAGISTGNPDVDAITAGLVNSTLTVVAARPSMGKTAYMLLLAEIAAKSGVVTGIYSLEQSRLALAERFAVREAMLDGHNVRTGMLSEADRFALLEGARVLGQLPILIDDTPNLSVSEIAASARRMKRRKGLGLVLIDYLQYIKADDLRIPREQQVAQITKRLKGLAKNLDIPVVVLAQLNRGVESREDKRPRLADLRESGAIEQDADMVLFIHRPDQYNPLDRPGEAEIIVAKNRDGRTGIANLVYRKHCFRFDPLSREEPQPPVEWSK
jgi:replicative DNA helicase